MSISPKRANSTPDHQREPRWAARHEAARHAPAVMKRLIAEHKYQLKFVIDSRADCEDVLQYLAELPEIAHDRVMLMPQGVDSGQLAQISAWLEPYCEEQGFVFCPRRHIEWFGLVRGT